MATIQKIFNKHSTSYKVLIRNKGLKPIIKTFKKKHLAISFINKIEGDRELRLSYSDQDLYFYDVAQSFLKDHKVKNQKALIQQVNFWIDKFYEFKITEIKTQDILTHFNGALYTKKNSTKNRYRSALNGVFRYANLRFNLRNNPIKNIPFFKENNQRIRFLSKEEKTRLFEASKASQWDKLYLLILLALTTGARKGELLNLRWKNIDFEKSLAFLETSKNKHPRVMPLTKDVLKELKKFIEGDDDLIFRSEIATARPFEFKKQWIKALRRADIKDFRFHDLRHTCASYLAQNGASLLEIADVLGHKQIQMTKRYAHLCVSHKQKLIEKYFGEI